MRTGSDIVGRSNAIQRSFAVTSWRSFTSDGSRERAPISSWFDRADDSPGGGSGAPRPGGGRRPGAPASPRRKLAGNWLGVASAVSDVRADDRGNQREQQHKKSQPARRRRVRRGGGRRVWRHSIAAIAKQVRNS